MSPRRFPGSIRDRILLPYLLLTVAMVGVTGLACGQWAADRAWEQSLERGRGIAETLRRSSFPLTESVLRQLKGLGGAEFALIGPRGQVEASTLEPTGTGPTPTSADLSFATRWSHAGHTYRVAAIDRPREPRLTGMRRLLILLPESALRAAAWEARRAALILSLVGAVLAAALASWVGRTLSNPLSAILRAIRRVGAGDLHPEGLPRGRDDEIGELAEGVARMAARLGDLERDRQQTERLRLIRQLSAGLAHELRNPLTAARMTLQLYAERNRDRDIEPLHVALAELGRMERQVRRFLQIARPDPPRFEPVGIGPILSHAAAGLAATAEHQGVRLRIETVDGLPALRADPDQLGQVVSNLLLNALEAAGPGGTVRLAASTDGPALVAIDVNDDGPGLPPADVARLFQPFFTTKPEGVGIGLALCEALVREHGGSIHYERIGEQTRFRVSLPVAEWKEPVSTPSFSSIPALVPSATGPDRPCPT